jgi:TatD DNase family protein
MIDTHCHLTFPDYEGVVDETLADAREAGVHTVITIATGVRNGTETVALAEQHDGLFATTGVHPLYAHEGPHDWALMTETARHPKCVAFGELGLDLHYDGEHRPVQRAVLDEQLEAIASSGLDLPIVVHCREAFDELIPVLEASGLAGERFVFHCFTAGVREMEMVLAFGAMASFTGVVTYKNARDVQEAAAMILEDRVMVETDAPFLTPTPHRGVRPNAPKFVPHIAAKIAALKGVDEAAFERTLDDNARRFFRLPG